MRFPQSAPWQTLHVTIDVVGECQYSCRASDWQEVHIKLRKSGSVGSNQAVIINANESEVSNDKYTQVIVFQ